MKIDPHIETSSYDTILNHHPENQAAWANFIPQFHGNGAILPGTWILYIFP